jgi:L-fucose isomerase
MADKVNIGIISFSDGRKRVHDGLLPGILEHQSALATVVESLGATPVVADQVAWTPRTAVAQAKALVAEDVAALVVNLPVFAFPNLACIAAVVAAKPVAVCSPGEPQLPGMGGMLGAAGALRQIGLYEERIWGPYRSPKTKEKLESFVRAAATRHRMRGQVYGQIGGRSIGMMTGTTASPAEWLRVFGVDIDHVDESEILRRAALVADTDRERIVGWLEGNLGAVRYEEGSKLTRDTLKEQAACAAAVKGIIEERQFDFVGIKCHYDMSEYHCTQCLSAAFLPFTRDWDGEREPVACGCEADGDGAMTMQILQLLSGAPALFMDLRHYDTESGVWTMCNCGGQSLHYAARSRSESDNLARTELVPVIPKYGGVGCHVRYVGEPGELTFARLTHSPTAPELLVFRGRAIEAEPGWLEQSCPAWPHVFGKLEADHGVLIDNLHANHIHAVEGDHVDAIKKFARMAGVDCVVL